MQTFKVLVVQTEEDKRRAEAVRSAEAERKRASALPFFFSGDDLPCKTHPTPDDFTETGVQSYGRRARARAKAACGGCPFPVECLTWAVETGQSGVFGGEWLIGGRIRRRR